MAKTYIILNNRCPRLNNWINHRTKEWDTPKQRPVMRSRDGEVKHISMTSSPVRDEARALTEVGEDETRVDKAARRRSGSRER